MKLWELSFTVYILVLNSPFLCEKIDDVIIESKIKNNLEQQKAYFLSGLESVSSVPVLYPEDICLLSCNRTTFATALHWRGIENTQKLFTIFRHTGNAFQIEHQENGDQISRIDCASFKENAYVLYLFRHNDFTDSEGTSMVFQLLENGLRPIQRFDRPFQRVSKFVLSGGNLFLVQIYNTPNEFKAFTCAVLKWTAYEFDEMGQLPCRDVSEINLFTIDGDIFVMVGVYVDKLYTTASSVLYKWDQNLRKFAFQQKFSASHVVDLKFFVREIKGEPQHFLIIANERKGEGDRVSSNNTLWKYTNGRFIPTYMLHLSSVCKFLALEGVGGQLLLLATCEQQGIQTFEFDGLDFVKSKVQFAKDIAGTGISKLRPYYHDNNAYIVIIHNEQLTNDIANVFVVKFQQSNSSHLKYKVLDWWKGLSPNLIKNEVQPLWEQIHKTSASTNNYFSAIREQMIERRAVVQMFLCPEYNITKQFWKKILLCGKVISQLENKLKSYEGARGIARDHFDKMLQAAITINELKLKGNITFRALNNLSRDELNVDSVNSPYVVTQNVLIAPNTAKNVQPSQSFLRINVTSLKVLGEINSVESSNFERTFLARNINNQSFENIFHAKRLLAKKIAAKNTINGVYTTQIVRTSGTSFVVNQDLLFAKPLYAQHLIINERLNNIHVLQGDLNVLYTKLTKAQTITTSKTFENVKLLEPIVLQGQIQSSTLDIMNPVSTIHNNILLEGDYVISGLITISNLLKTFDILDKMKPQSFVKLLREGIRKDSTEIDLNLSFIHTIRSKSMEAASINKLSSGDLMLTGTSDSQFVGGRKIFTSDLHVRNGTINALQINSINVGELKDTVLQFIGRQIVEGIVHFKRIKAPRLHHNRSLILKSTPFDNILTANNLQNISNSVVTKKMNTNSMRIQNIDKIQSIFGINFENLLEDSIYNGKQSNILRRTVSYSKLNVNNLFVLNAMNNMGIRGILDTVASLVSNAEVRRAIRFSSSTVLSHLHFSGTLNNVFNSDIESNWLLKDFDQSFEKPQTIAKVKCSSNLLLNNSINGHQLNVLVSKTSYINKEDALTGIIFENSAYVYESLKENSVNHSLSLKNTFLLSQSSILQQISFPSSCGNVLAKKIFGLEYINDIQPMKLKTFLANPLENTRITLKGAIFNEIPAVNVVNHKTIRDILQQAWFTNENIVLAEELLFHEVLFGGAAISESTINGVNLLDLANTYFSLTLPQTINTELRVQNAAIFENSLNIRMLNTAGNIADLESNTTIDLLIFVSNILVENYNQKITGAWTFDELMIPGDVKNVLVNNLNFCNDVMRYDIATNDVTATKYFQNVAVQRLHCDSRSTINQIVVVNWMEESILVYGNYTIQGTTTFKLPNIYNNIEVLGTVNDMSFNPDIILLNNTDQNLQGHVNIITKYPEDNKILSLVFEDLHVQSLQGVEMENFLNCLAKTNHTTTHGNLVFRKSLNVNRLGTKQDLFNMNTRQFLNQYSGNNKIASTIKAIQSLKTFAQTAVKMNGTKNTISRFQNIQNLTASWIQTAKYVHNMNGTVEEFLGVLERGNEACIQFYAWNQLETLLTRSPDLGWCTSDDALILDIQSIHLQEQSIVVALIASHEREHFILQLLVSSGDRLRIVNYVNVEKNENFSVLNINSDPCLLIYSSKNVAVKIICLEVESSSYDLIDRGYLQMSSAKKVYTLEDALLFTFSEPRMEIWYPYKTIVPEQITTPAAIISLDTAKYQNYKYIAVLVNYGSAQSVEVYRSRSNEDFILSQSLGTHSVVKVKLAVHKLFKNFVLYTISNIPKPSVIVYKFKGVSGFSEFTKILSSSEILSVVDYDISRHQLLFVTTSDAIRVIELL